MTNSQDFFAKEREPGSLSLPAAWRIVAKRRWLVAAIAISVPAIVGAIVSKEPKSYEAAAALVIEPTVPQYMGQDFKDVVDVEANWWSAQETLQTELRVLKSFSQALAVAKAFCDKRIGPDQTPVMSQLYPGVDCTKPEDLSGAAKSIQAQVRVEPVKDSRIVNVVAIHQTGELAASLANVMAQVYTERNLERRLNQSEGAASWLGDEFGDLATQLNAAEQALIEFKRRNNVVAVPIEDQQSDLATKHKKLAEELSNVQLRLIALRAQREEFATLVSDDPLKTITPSTAAESSVLSKLKELYLDQYGKLLELRGKYLDKHPAIVTQEARVASVRSDLAREASMVTKQLDATYNSLVKEERDLRGALDGATREALQLQQRAIDYNRLKRNYDRLVKLSDQVGGRERETTLARHLKTNNVRLLDAALVPGAAVSPDVPRAVAIAAVVALIFALGLAFLLEILDSTVKSPDDIEAAMGLVFLGLVPRIDTPEASNDVKELYVVGHPKSAVAECCRSIRTNLLFMTPDRPAKTLMITSAGPQEGKTTTTVNLAVTMALSGLKVLIVDTDMRRPRLHKVFGVPASNEGLSIAIVGDEDARSMIRQTGIPGLALLPCGALPPNPAELLHADRFKRIIEELAAGYDRVIFDSPPVGVVTDAAILSRLTQATILVAKAGRTSKDALRSAHRLLADGSVNVLGCVLNDVELSRVGSYGYYYYSQYGQYYDNDERLKPAESASGVDR